ncbi:MAG: hypothetical protein KDA37_09845, partial [Planctomycetales bacterium]|nr:hypothetical protein [Planctomycetales bacterium]
SNVNAANSVYPANLYGDSTGLFTTLQVQQGDGSANPTFWGPEFGFARTMGASGETNIMVIKASRGGGGNGLWDKETFEGNSASGHMWGHLRDTVDTALAQIPAGDSFEIKGFLHLQGESNSTAEAAAADARLQNLIDNLKRHINANYSNAAAGMYSVVGEIAASQSSSSRVTTTVLQEALGDSSSQIAFVRTRDLPLKSDGIHFGGSQKLEIGRRFADAFLSQGWTENPSLLAGYSAGAGSVNAIPHPIAQGLRELGAQVPGVTMEGIDDAGTPAWRMLDDSRNINPEYRREFGPGDFQEMFLKGWVFKATARVIRGGGLALWGVNTDTDQGWGVNGPSGSLNGFQFERVNGDELQVGLWLSETQVNLGPGSADQYHTFELRGAAGSSLFDFYIDGALQTAGVDLTSGPGQSGYQDALVFSTGSTPGSGLEVYWKEVSLSVTPEPSGASLLTSLTAFIASLWRSRSLASYVH